MRHQIKIPGSIQYQGFTYHIKGDSLICVTSGGHPPTPPGYRLVRTCGKIVRGVLTCHTIEFKRSCGAMNALPHRAPNTGRHPQAASPYSQIPEVEHE